MKKIIEYKMENGEKIYMEVEEDPQERMERVGRGDKDEPEEAETRFEKAVDQVRPAAEYILKRFQDMNTPDEISLEFGLKFSGKTSALFASASTEANFKVAMKWKNEKSPQPSQESDAESDPE